MPRTPRGSTARGAWISHASEVLLAHGAEALVTFRRGVLHVFADRALRDLLRLADGNTAALGVAHAFHLPAARVVARSDFAGGVLALALHDALILPFHGALPVPHVVPAVADR